MVKFRLLGRELTGSSSVASIIAYSCVVRRKLETINHRGTIEHSAYRHQNGFWQPVSYWKVSHRRRSRNASESSSSCGVVKFNQSTSLIKSLVDSLNCWTSLLSSLFRGNLFCSLFFLESRTSGFPPAGRLAGGRTDGRTHGDNLAARLHGLKGMYDTNEGIMQCTNATKTCCCTPPRNVDSKLQLIAFQRDRKKNYHVMMMFANCKQPTSQPVGMNVC